MPPKHKPSISFSVEEWQTILSALTKETLTAESATREVIAAIITYRLNRLARNAEPVPE